MNRTFVARVYCSRCGRGLEECAFCDEPDCPAAICYGCVNLALGQKLPQTHVHED
jgi:hypothetical protein